MEQLPNSRPTKDEALQLALMLNAGMPSSDAIRYFFSPDEDPQRLQFEHERWLRSEAVQKALLQVMGKAWQDMSLDERVKFAVDKHYAEMAYFLYAHNYGELVGTEKQKADTCRQALEAKLAGSAGKMNALSQWFEDVRVGRVKLPSVMPA